MEVLCTDTELAPGLATAMAISCMFGPRIGRATKPPRDPQDSAERIEAARLKRERKNQKRLRTAELARGFGLIED